jgi:hypothetical protein
MGWGRSVTPALIAKVLEVGLVVWLGLMALLIFCKLLRGTINARGLLADNPETAGTEMQPERAVAMLVFPLVLLHLAVGSMSIDASVQRSLPDVPEYLVTLLTGGNGVYLAGKMLRKKGALS